MNNKTIRIILSMCIISSLITQLYVVPVRATELMETIGYENAGAVNTGGNRAVHCSEKGAIGSTYVIGRSSCYSSSAMGSTYATVYDPSIGVLVDGVYSYKDPDTNNTVATPLTAYNQTYSSASISFNAPAGYLSSKIECIHEAVKIGSQKWIAETIQDDLNSYQPGY